MLDETDIQKLLRLKRYEQPPEGYHRKFLQEFHRCQRAEMLRQPLWKIAMDRMGAFFSDHSMGRMAYGTATAAVLLFAGIASYNMVNGSGGFSQPQIAFNSGSGTSQNFSPIAPTTPAADQLKLDGQLDYHQPAPLPQLRTAQTTDPHYIIDSRPVSYERPFSF
jgi:hypothetical protein